MSDTITEELSELKELRILHLYDSTEDTENVHFDITPLEQIFELTISNSKIKNFHFQSDNLKYLYLNECSLKNFSKTSFPFLQFLKIQECQGKKK